VVSEWVWETHKSIVRGVYRDCGGLMGMGEEMSSDCVIDVIRVLSKFEHLVSNRTILWVYYEI